jgi:DNA-binding GntR family transcriptional regulator
VLAGEGSPLRTAVLRQLEVEKTTIHNAVQRLAATAEVEVVERKYTIVDPLFAEWIDSLRAP